MVRRMVAPTRKHMKEQQANHNKGLRVVLMGMGVALSSIASVSQAAEVYAKADGDIQVGLLKGLKAFEHSGIIFTLQPQNPQAVLFSASKLPFNPDIGSRTLSSKTGAKEVQVNLEGKTFPVDDVWRSEAARVLGLDEGIYLKGLRPVSDADRAQIRARYGSSGDLNSDGVVDLSDLAILAGNYGKKGPGLRGDLNNDGKVDGSDVELFSQLYTFK
jgi:hypothetical protein